MFSRLIRIPNQREEENHSINLQYCSSGAVKELSPCHISCIQYRLNCFGRTRIVILFVLLRYLNVFFRFSFQDAKNFVNQSANRVNLDVFVDTKYAFNPHNRIVIDYVSVGIYESFQPDKVIEELDKLKDGKLPYNPPNLDFDMIIATNMHWLKIFRIALEERFKSLQDVKAAIDWWKCSHTEEKEKKRFAAIDVIAKSLEQEEKDLIEVLYLLPSCKTLDSPDLVSEVLLLQRKQIEDALAREMEAQKKSKLTDQDQMAIATLSKLREKTKTRKKLNVSSKQNSSPRKPRESVVQIFSEERGSALSPLRFEVKE